MHVSTAISDLFFNTHHATDGNGYFTDLYSEAIDFLVCIKELTDDYPSVTDLIADFNDRL